MFLSWHQLDFAVPLTSDDKTKVRTQQKLFGDLSKNKSGANIVAGIHLSSRDKDMKEVLHNCSGYAKPMEMIANGA